MGIIPQYNIGYAGTHPRGHASAETIGVCARCLVPDHQSSFETSKVSNEIITHVRCLLLDGDTIFGRSKRPTGKYQVLRTSTASSECSDDRQEERELQNENEKIFRLTLGRSSGGIYIQHTNFDSRLSIFPNKRIHACLYPHLPVILLRLGPGVWMHRHYFPNHS